MRRDMKDVIVTPGRNQKGTVHNKTRPTNDPDKLDEMPRQEGIRRRWDSDGWGWTFGDHINPLRGFLKKNVGRPFDEVFSEFSEYCDRRNLRGWHLRDHLRMEVDTWNTRQCKLGHSFRRPREFYIDPDGILRHDPSRGWKKTPKEYDPDNCEINGVRYKRINNCWFEVSYKTRQIKKQYWSLFEEKWIYYFVDEEYMDSKRQLNKKDLKHLGLSNDPDFCWWKKAQ